MKTYEMVNLVTKRSTEAIQSTMKWRSTVEEGNSNLFEIGVLISRALTDLKNSSREAIQRDCGMNQSEWDRFFRDHPDLEVKVEKVFNNVDRGIRDAEQSLAEIERSRRLRE